MQRGENHRSEDKALAVLAAFVALVAIHAVMSRPSAKSSEAALARVMPANYEPVLAALIRASGDECDKICASTLDPQPLTAPHILAGCAIAAKSIACANARQYEISVHPTAEPSR